MANDERKPWEQQLRDVAAHAEEDLRRVLTYINDEVVPDIRHNGSQALRAASVELQRLAQWMDERRGDVSGQAPPSPPGDNTKTEKDKPKP